ncbi:MAG TPA: pyruvate formate lyase family protein [Syntrophales bacterium]|nr:pyruvate formate lyase family protein [Syntrophales bacterium]
MEAAKDLRSKFVSKAVRNVQRGYMDDNKSRGLFRPEVKLDIQRSRLMTESFKQTDGQAMILRRAKALAHVLNNMGIFIRDWERIVGYQTSKPEGIYHPIDMNWKSVKRLVNSEGGKTLLDDADRKELEEICQYWKGKCMSDRQQEAFTGDLGKYWQYEGTFLWTHWSELGVPDYEGLLREGLSARIKRAEARLEEIDRTIPPDYIDQKEFLQSAIIVLQAVIDFSHRYSALAAKMAKTEKDRERKKSLEEIAHSCEWIPANPPRTFIEAVQFFYFIHLIRYLEYSTLGIGLRLDYILGPYYEKDIKEGKIKRTEALEILQLLWVKFLELGLVYSPLVTSVYGGVASLQAITIGGLDRAGRDVTNDLTYLALETAKTMRTIEPSIAMRVHKNTPDQLLSAAIDVIRTGIGYPSLFNDEVLIPLLKKWGVPENDANAYGVSGCVYMEIPGKNITRRVLGYFVLTKCLWWALHQGVNPKTGEQRGARTPDPATFKSWVDVLDAYVEQVKFFTTKMTQVENTCRDLYAKYCPKPFYSAIVDGCIEQGKECKQWIYPSMVHDFAMVIGGTNVADSITAIRKVVFDDKLVTLPELIKIMDQNWEGYEDIRQACLNAPKYGNDDDYADTIAREVHHRSEAAMETVKDRFGYSIRGDGSAVSATYGLAADTPATPDGRMDGGPFADSTLAPQPGADKKGPTAVLNSCAKIDTMQTYNHLLNQKFPPQYLEGDMKPVFLSYLKTWRDKKISHIQFNVVDKKTLIDAQQYPDKYRDLIVRVAGFSAYFADLSKGLQDHIIARTEHEL